MSFEPKRLCPGCGSWVYVGDFYIGHNKCPSCLSARKAARWAVDDDYRARQIRRMKFITLMSGARKRAGLLGVDFDLDDHRDLLRARFDRGECELTGLPFHLEKSGGSRRQHHPRTPSFDRKTPSLGYTYENIRVVCFAINAAMGSWGEDAAAEIMQAWIEKRTTA